MEGTSGVTQPNPLLKQGHLQQAVEDLVQAGLEYLQRRRLHSLPGQPGPGLRQWSQSDHDVSVARQSSARAGRKQRGWERRSCPGGMRSPNARAQPALAMGHKGSISECARGNQDKSWLRIPGLIAPGPEESGSPGTVAATLMRFDGYPRSPGMASPCGDRALGETSPDAGGGAEEWKAPACGAG